MTAGVYIAILGVDGSGKSTLAAALRTHLESIGREVVDAGTEAVLARAKETDGFPWSTLNSLAAEGWRLYLEAPTQSGVLTSGLLEFTAHHLIRAEVIAPALARGAVVLSDSFGLKNVVKTLRAAQHMPGPQAATVDGLVTHLGAAMADPYLQPDVGLLLDADPDLAYRWRIAQRGELEPGADLTVAGQSGRESFVDFQRGLAEEYRAHATRCGWHVLPVDGRPRTETIDSALDFLMAHPSMQGER